MVACREVLMALPVAARRRVVEWLRRTVDVPAVRGMPDRHLDLGVAVREFLGSDDARDRFLPGDEPGRPKSNRNDTIKRKKSAPSSPQPPRPTEAHHAVSVTAVKALLAEKKPGTQRELVLVLAAYLTAHHGPSFRPRHLVQASRAAGLTALRNPSVPLAAARKEGWVGHNADNTWSLRPAGHALVNQLGKGPAVPPGRSRRKSRPGEPVQPRGKPVSNAEWVTALAGQLPEGHASAFRPRDISAVNAKAGRPAFTNVTMAMSHAAKRGWLKKNKDKTWTLTPAGKAAFTDVPQMTSAAPRPAPALSPGKMVKTILRRRAATAPAVATSATSTPSLDESIITPPEASAGSPSGETGDTPAPPEAAVPTLALHVPKVP